MSRKRALNFDQWQTFSENYKPIRELQANKSLIMEFLQNYQE